MRPLLILCFLFFSSFLVGQKVYDQIFHEYNNADFDFDEVIMGDLDGQGNPDFVVVSYSKKKIFVGLAQGLDAPVLNVIDDQFKTEDLIIYDFDNDGDNDIVGSVLFEDKTLLWSNDGTGSFTRSELPLEGYRAIHFRDLDDDGFDELLIGIDDELRVYLLDDGVITFQQIVHEEEFGGTPDAITTYDENFDNIYDIAAAYEIGGLRLFEQDLNVPLFFVKNNVEPNEFNNDQMAVTDIDNDLKVDMLTHSKMDEKTTLFMNRGDGTYDDMTIASPKGANTYSRFIDYEGDGDMDIIYLEDDGSTTTISVLQNDLGSFDKKVFLSNNYNAIYSGGVEDVDGDGDKDMYFGTNENGKAGILLFINTGISSTQNVEISQANVSPTIFDKEFEVLEEGRYDYIISNISGHVVAKGNASGMTRINGSLWKPGMYLITLQKEGALSRNKIIKF